LDAHDRADASPNPRLAVAQIAPAHFLVEADRVPLGLPLHSARAELAPALGGVFEEVRADPLADPFRLDPEIVEPANVALQGECRPADGAAVDVRDMELLFA
jgi:hypothetical protein